MCLRHRYAKGLNSWNACVQDEAYRERMDERKSERQAPGNHVVRNVKDQCQKTPSMVARVLTFRQAWGKWNKAGRPVRSKERVAELMGICQSCPCFRPLNRSNKEAGGTCTMCGCRVRRAGNQLNKLAFATEGCPLDEPKFLADV